jgi:hypothetical protein
MAAPCRKKHRRKWVKRTDVKRRCPSGKHGYAKSGEAQAKRPDLNVYRCPECKRFHPADPIGRKERKRRARGDTKQPVDTKGERVT